MIALTETATSKVKELIEAEGQPELFLRVAVRPGGCSGLSLRDVLRQRAAPPTTSSRSTARSRSSSTPPAPSTSTARRSTTRTASRAPGSRSTTRTRSAPAAAASRSRNRFFGSSVAAPLRAGPYRVRLLREVLERGLHLVLADRAVETGRDLPGRVDAEEPRLAREVPRGDGRRRLVGAQVLVDVDVDDVRRGPCRCRRAAAGCRAPGRSTATGSGRASRTTPRPACLCR